MNIGFDGKRAANNLTGLGNYSRSLILQLSQFFPQNHYFVYAPKVKSDAQISSFFEHQNISLQLPDSGQPSFLWRSWRIKKQLKKDHLSLYHGLSNEVPFDLAAAKIKTVVTIHDLIYLRFPQHYTYIDRTIYNFKSEYACKHADHIIAISEQTKKDIVTFYGTDPDKIEVIYQSCDDSFKHPVKIAFKDTVREKYKLPERYLLNVGTIEPRKNLLLIVQALQSIPENVKLLVVGKAQPYAQQVIQEIARLNLQDRIIFLKNIPFTDLPAIYQMASIFVYPSFYEGFGIPVIEALYGGIPVIAATGSCLEEAGGPGSLYIDPKDPAALATAINAVLNNPALAKQMREKGLSFVQKFNTCTLAHQLMNCYQNIVSAD
jgi:glycosyltransferase involved in cell wall biosynthesis